MKIDEVYKNSSFSNKDFKYNKYNFQCAFELLNSNIKFIKPYFDIDN